MMSTEASFDEDNHGQTNDSIITKVKTRVSNIFPSVVNWFSSPGPSTNNGSVRRRRDSESESDEEGNANTSLPQSKRRKSDVTTHQTNTPIAGPSNSRRLSMPLNATPADQLMRNRLAGRQQPQQMTSSPYDFAARNPSMTLMASPIQIRDSEDEEDSEEEETDEVQLVQQEETVTKRKGIHETQYNVLRMSSQQSDRSTSEPPIAPTVGPSSRRFGFGLQSEVIPENSSFQNGNDEATSENSDFTQPRASRPDRLSGFLGNRNKNMSASTGQLSFQAHLETEKSLFAEQRRQFNPSVYGSSWSLNSGGSGSRFHRNFSPFYGGQTMYGGAAAYSRRDNRLQQTLRVPTMIRPSSRLSNASSSSSLASVGDGSSQSNAANQNTGLSNTSKRILELLNQCTSPLKDARKMGTGLNTSVRVPSLMNNSTFNRTGRFNDADLNASRSVRLTQPKTPYSRPTAPLPPTAELQIPSISQLLQMKRLLNSTAEVKKLAEKSKSALNQVSEYTLPGGDQSNSSTNKYTNKVKEKLTTTRDKPNAADIAPEPVNLPNIQLPNMKSVPKFDIAIPEQKSFISTNSSKDKSTNIFATLNFGNNNKSAKKDDDVIEIDDDDENDDDDEEDESDEEEEEEDDDEDQEENTQESNESTSNGSMQFKFSSPVPILSKQVPANPSDSSKNFKFSNPLSVGAQSLEVLKPDMSLAKKKIESPVVVAKEKPEGIAVASELKAGSCLDALFGKKADASLPMGTPMGFGSQFKMASSQWECPACMIRNDNANEKCVACNSAKPGAKPEPQKSLKTTDSGFTSLLAAQKAKWECPSCMSQNDQSAEKCPACTEPKPGSKPKVETAPIPAIPLDNSFKKLVEQQKASKWECKSCLTQNEQTQTKCACCEEAKPGSAPEKVPQFSFNSGSTTSKFSFGVPKDVAASSSSTPQSSFVFGNVAKPSGTSENAPNKGFSFGTTVTKADTAAKPTFSFGVPASTTTSSIKTDAVSSSTVNNTSGGFSFGVSSSVAPKTEAISSAADTSSPRLNKRTLDETDSSTKPTTATFTFGKTNEAQAKPAFSASTTFGSLASSTNNTVSSSGGFSFQKVTSAAVTTASVTKDDSSSQISSTATTNAITTPIFGSGVSGIKPLDRSFGGIKPSTTANDDASKKGTLIFGAAKKDEGIKPSTGGFTFGQSSTTTMKPADQPTSSIFGGAASLGKPETKPGFSFMTPNVEKPAAATGTTQENKPTFGMFSANNSPKTTTFGFGGNTEQPKTQEAPKPVFGSSFGNASDTNKSVFGSAAPQAAASATTPAASPFVFGSAQPAPPAFNNTQNAQQQPTPLSGTPSSFGSTTPSSNIFGSANNSPASVFGQASTENKLPAFGASNAFGSPSPFGANAATARSASSVSSPFGDANDEPNNKKLNTGGFQFNAQGPNTSSTGSAAGSPFVFGNASATPNMDNNNSKGAFSFTPEVKPTFNFSANAGMGSNNPTSTTATNVPYQFGSTSPPPGVFSFGATPVLEQPQNQTPPVFEFGSSNINNNASNNPFAPGQSVGMQQRRKIKATRRIVR